MSRDATYTVPAGRTPGGRLRVPGSKSLTQRYYNLALLERAPLEVRNPLDSEDPRLFLGALEAAGFAVEHRADRVLLAPGAPPSGEVAIFCGNGGTMFRFLTAALCTVPPCTVPPAKDGAAAAIFRLDGVPRLRERPVGPLIDALRQLGARIECPEQEGHAPLLVHGASLDGGRAVLDAGVSSQYLSALLMASLRARRPVEIEVAALTSEPYVELTLDAAAEFGARIERQERLFRVTPSPLAAGTVSVEGDYSAAAYPAAMAALCGTRVVLEGLDAGSRQGDRGFIDLLARMGAEVRFAAGELTVEGGALRALDVDMSAVPDQVPTLAALAPFARGTTRIHGVPHLRIKESDRLAAMARGLERLGAAVEELDDGLVIPGVWSDKEPPTELVEIDTWGDHRIAMSFAVAGLRRPGVVIREPAVVGKSYPGFWRDFEALLGV